MMTNVKFKLFFKQIISLFISICIMGQSSLSFAMQTPKQQREEFIDYLKEEQDRLKTLFDQEPLLEELDYDTNKIIDFVSNKIVYQAYDGVLRGAKGTLIGRAGNSHDQAITLAGMLNDAGLEAEILVGKLTVEQATELNLTIASPQFSELKETISSSKSIVAKRIVAKAEELVKTDGENISDLMKETDALAERIFKQLPKDEIKKGMEDFKASVHNSAISYRWVRYRLAQGKKWIEVHPAYTEAKKWNLTPSSFEKNSVNSDDLQQFSVEVWIENSVGEKQSISGLWKKPAANLLDRTLSIEVGSDAMLKTDLWEKPKDMLKQSHFFFIKIDGKLPKGGKVFDLNGNVYSGDSLSGLNTVFSTLNKTAQKATDALSSLSFNNKPEVISKKQLTKVWLEFTLEKPNTKSRNIKRVIFDDNALENTGKTAMRLLQSWNIDIATTIPMKQFYQNKKSTQVINAIEGLERYQTHINHNPNINREEVIGRYAEAIGNPNEVFLTHKRSIFDQYKSDQNTVSYHHEPHILAIRHGLNKSDEIIGGYEMTDIVSNQRWSFTKLETGVIPSTHTSLKYGVWETRTESSRIQSNNQNVIKTESAYKKLNETKTFIKKLNEKSKTINFYSSNKEKTWWDIDLETGSTIGMGLTEYGSGGVEFTEYGMKLIILAVAVYFSFMLAAVSYKSCRDGGGSFACCLSVNGGLFIVGAAFGVAGLVVEGLGVGAALTVGGSGINSVGTLISILAGACENY